MDTFTGFLNNAALMLILCVAYDTFSIYGISNQKLREGLTGVLVGLICIAVMLNPWSLEKGLYFDTRWVLLSLCGLFFGTVPTAIAVAIAGAFRLYVGGPGGIVGTVVIVVTAAVGLAARHWQEKRENPPNWLQLYLFGVVVQLAMLSCMFLFPAAMRIAILKKIALPILLIYPVLTAVIGLILKKQEVRRIADRKLLYSTALATAALESTPDGILIVNREGKATRWNQRFIELWKVPPHLLDMANNEELLAYAASQLADPDEFLARVTDLYRHPEETGTDTLYFADGRIFERYTQPQKVGAEVMGRFWSFHDITEQRNAAESLQMMRFCVDHAGDSMFWINSEGRILYVNDAACQGLGYSREELLSMRVFDLDPDFTPAVWGPHSEALRQRGSFTFETRHRAKDGRVFPVEVTANYVHFGGHEFNFATTRDITERKRILEERLKLEQQLLHAQKLESLGVLAGGIAHDFNNLLTSIIGNADLALMRINPESPAIDNLHSIEKASARAADLARQMLAYSGKGKFVISNHDVNDLLEEMLHILQVSISKKAVLRLNLTRPLPPVEGDATQIRQVIMNLVINASEAIGDRSGVIAITTGCMDCDRSYLKDVWLDENIKDGLYVFIEIADTGCGMSKETLAKLFDPFFTTKFTGRGLGMAAVLGIIRGHKGAVKVYSEVGKGSTFKILLPASGKPAEIFNHDTGSEHWRGSGTVLLVDDEETVRAIGSEMLREMGFDVVTANDGRAAVDVFRSRNDIAFVILDLTMPHMDGEQCFRELRALNPKVKVIMSSGFGELEVTQKFVGKGLAGFVQKPYKFTALRDCIAGLDIDRKDH
ncbi:LytS/YhcK type 5TM receptor domain-containing protein [Geomesophilobacter sediminis]|uniref:histidine kinase n=1 Tax=Geomesophilobacter sediminis TaxID=2798584 RepID=A0A8J7JFM1_9BACT|nr:LytS/YhcK type 5TM receptor domain-containing protein [Geomesophilobacter sediminis]MBJ6726351.1 PAS domain S-box protein [Geomesophilobacter sediminis]